MNCMTFPQIYRDSLWRSEERRSRLDVQIGALEASHFIALSQNTTAGVGVAVFLNFTMRRATVGKYHQRQADLSV